MKQLPKLFPDADVLEQVEGVARGLRQRRRLSAIGGFASVLFATLQVGQLLYAKWFSGLKEYPWRDMAQSWPFLLPLFLLLFSALLVVWSRFWLRESEAPFRYTYSVGDFASESNAPTIDRLAWLRHDLLERLSQRIGRLSLLEEKHINPDQSHIHIEGRYLVRKKSGDDRWLVEITPWVRVGAASAPETLAHPVKFRLSGTDTAESSVPSPSGPGPAAANTPAPAVIPPLGAREYEQILERVYFSVATQVYRQIRKDVEEKISLLPTNRFRAVAYLHEAEDYARSNTLDAYDAARELFDAALRLYDRHWRPVPDSPWPRWRLPRAFRGTWRSIRRRAAQVWPGGGRRQVLIARAEIGYANMLLYRRDLAGVSGNRINPVFEARPVASRSVDRLRSLPATVPRQRETLFDAHVGQALAWVHLGSISRAEGSLAEAERLMPDRARLDTRYLFGRGRTRTSRDSVLVWFRNAVDLDPNFEIAQLELARRSETLWRRTSALEREVADLVFKEYDRVLALNPGNIRAWAAQGYMRWLLDEPEDIARARDAFQSGREYKEIKRETFVAELDHGLARIAAEAGTFGEAHEHFQEAVAAFWAQGSSYGPGGPTASHFDPMSEAMQERFRRYRNRVAEHWQLLRNKGTVDRYFEDALARLKSETTRAEALRACADLCLWIDRRLTVSERTSLVPRLEGGDLGSLAAQLRDPAPDSVERLSRILQDVFIVELLRKHLRSAPPERIRDVVYAFVLNDFGEASYNYYLNSGNTRALEEARASIKEAIERDPHCVMAYYNLHLLERGEQRYEEAVTHLECVRAERPDWPDNILALAEVHAEWARRERERAKAEREAAERKKKEAEDKKAEASGKARRASELAFEPNSVPGTIPSTLPPMSKGRKAPEAALPVVEYRRGIDVLNREARQLEEEAAHLEGEAQAHERMATECEARARASERDATERPRALLPHVWLWDTKGGGGGFDWSVLDRNDFKVDLRWEREFDDLHVRALSTWARALVLQEQRGAVPSSPAAPSPGARLLRHLRERFEPDNFYLLLACRDLPWENDVPAVLRAIVEHWHAENPSAFWSLTWVPDAYGVTDQVRIYGDSLGGPLSPNLLLWLGAQLESLQPRATKHAQAIDRILREGLTSITLFELLGNEGQRLLEAPAETRPAALRERLGGANLDGLLNAATARRASERDPARQPPAWADELLRDPAARKHTQEWLEERRRVLSKGTHDPVSIYERALAGAVKASDTRLVVDILERLEESRGPLENRLRGYRQALELDPLGSVRAAGHYRRHLAGLLLAMERDREAIAVLDQLREAGAESGSYMKTIEATLPYISSVRAYHVLKAWLETARERAQRADHRAAASDARQALARLVRGKYQELGRGKGSGAPVTVFVSVHPIVLFIAKDLTVAGMEKSQDHLLFTKYLPECRRRIERDTGFTIPFVRVQTDGNLEAGSYLISVYEIPRRLGKTRAQEHFVPDAGTDLRRRRSSNGGAPPFEGRWLGENEAGAARTEGRQVFDAHEVMARDLELVLREDLASFASIDGTRELLTRWLDEGLPSKHAETCRKLRDDPQSLRWVTRMVRALVEERVPLTIPHRVLEGLAEASREAILRDAVSVVRRALADSLPGTEPDRRRVRLGPSLEATFVERWRSSTTGGMLALEPETLQELQSAVRTEIGGPEQSALVVAEQRLRPYVRYLIRDEWPDLPVLSRDELPPSLDLEYERLEKVDRD